MYQYTLDNKQMDRDFLDGLPVTGRAVLTPGASNPLREGDPVLVVLSSGKKYKGKVTKYSFFVLNHHQVGEIEIIRSR